MGIKKLFDKVKDTVQHEVKAAQGEEGKDKLFTAEHTYPDLPSAQHALEEAKQKLFDVDGWSQLSGINSTFTLFDETGLEAQQPEVQIGNYMRIELPGTKTENWVRVTHLQNEPDFAEFTVHPSEKPQAQDPTGDEENTKHFFTEEASSTFRVERNGNTIKASEIGRNEVINNDGNEAGSRAALNTLIAEGGWAFFQKLQWDKLTNYLVHNTDA